MILTSIIFAIIQVVYVETSEVMVRYFPFKGETAS
jgi:hypothetical protein